MSKPDYEKHQRDYTLLASMVVANEFFSREAKDFFKFEACPVYLFMEDGVFYHFLAKSDYLNWPSSYLANHSYDDLAKLIKKQKEILVRYRKFIVSDQEDIVVALERLYKYMNGFMLTILVVSYAPDFIDNLEKKIFDLCVEARVMLDDVHKVGMDKQKKLLNQLENKFNIEHDVLQYLTPDEFDIFIKKKKIPENIKERKLHFLAKVSKNGYKFYSNQEATSILKEISQPIIKDDNVDIIKGVKAFGGVVKGIVRRVISVDDANKVEMGEIIVASMTDPRYLGAMKKAVAFVTDEGGILCHAAIVARELKKPCVIGTKIATQVLKDGDEVEVDADNGLIRILK